ncbi:MAG: DUF3341 domain-containing protein [Oligoflexia bacterium]|nr:DUF3341 domain-containing protein [Oligoflexia bacterium]
MENNNIEKEKVSRNAVFAIFKERSTLESAIDSFKTSGFRNSDISVLMQSPSDSRDFAHEKNTKAPEGVAAGTTAGILTGGILGWLVGIGALSIPGIGPFIAAGPIVAAIAGAGIGATVGGVAGGIIGMGFPEYEAIRYEKFVKEGGILISVHVDDSFWENKAKKILELWGAKDISTVSEKKI